MDFWSSAERDLYAAVKSASGGRGIQSVAKDLGIVCGLSQHQDAPDDLLGQPQVAGQGKTCQHADLVGTRSFQVKTVRHEEGGYEREPRRFDDETTIGGQRSHSL